MPCHNGEKYIRESVDSIVNQKYEDWELLFIDDNSTDNSVNIINEYIVNDNRIKLLINPNPTGKPSAPRNYGIENAKGSYIAFCDCDDKWMPSKLEIQMKYFEKKDCSVVFSYYKKMDEDGNIHDNIITSPTEVTYRQLLNGNCIGNLTGIYNADLVGKVYQKDIGHEDYLMWLEILKFGNKAYNTNTVEAIYREQRNSTSGNKIQAFKWTWNIYRKGLELSFLQSVIHFVFYAIKGILKFLK